MTEISRVLANNLKRLREERGMTQADLAEALDVSLTTIQGYETGRKWPGTENFTKMLDIFQVEAQELFFGPKLVKHSMTVLQPDQLEAITKAVRDAHLKMRVEDENKQQRHQSLNEIISLLENQPESRLAVVLKLIRDFVGSDATVDRKKKNLR